MDVNDTVSDNAHPRGGCEDSLSAGNATPMLAEERRFLSCREKVSLHSLRIRPRYNRI